MLLTRSPSLALLAHARPAAAGRWLLGPARVEPAPLQRAGSRRGALIIRVRGWEAQWGAQAVLDACNGVDAHASTLTHAALLLHAGSGGRGWRGRRRLQQQPWGPVPTGGKRTQGAAWSRTLVGPPAVGPPAVCGGCAAARSLSAPWAGLLGGTGAASIPSAPHQPCCWGRRASGQPPRNRTRTCPHARPPSPAPARTCTAHLPVRPRARPPRHERARPPPHERASAPYVCGCRV
jgi:hypothetical protein